MKQAAEVQRLRSAELLRLGFVMALAMTLHNLPEGFAVSSAATHDVTAHHDVLVKASTDSLLGLP